MLYLWEVNVAISPEKLLAKIEESGEFTPEDSKELLVVLSNKSMQRALRYVLQIARERDKLSICDLVGQEGLAQAIGNQGEVRGIRSALDILMNLCEEQENGE
jgi:hypothetical protein